MKLAETKVKNHHKKTFLPPEFMETIENEFGVFYYDDYLTLKCSNNGPKIMASSKLNNFKISVSSNNGPVISFENNGMSFSTSKDSTSFYLKLSKYLRTRLKYKNGTATFQTTIPTIYDGELTYTYSVGKKFSTTSSLRVGRASAGLILSDDIVMFTQFRSQKWFFGALLESKKPSFSIVSEYKGEAFQANANILYLNRTRKPGFVGHLTYYITPTFHVKTAYSNFCEPGIFSFHVEIPFIKSTVDCSYFEEKFKFGINTYYNNGVKTIVKVQQPFCGYPSYSFFVGVDNKSS